MPPTAPPPSDDAAALHAALQAGPLAGQAVTTLRIGGSHTTLASGDGSGEPALRSLNIGARVTATTCFSHSPPTGADLEGAIALVEEAVMPARAMLAAGSALYTADAGIRRIAIAAGVEAQPEMQLALEDVERTFGHLAAVAGGRPAPADDWAHDPAFAATLLILRECMQHLGFGRIEIRSDGVL